MYSYDATIGLAIGDMIDKFIFGGEKVPKQLYGAALGMLWGWFILLFCWKG